MSLLAHPAAQEYFESAANGKSEMTVEEDALKEAIKDYFWDSIRKQNKAE